VQANDGIITSSQSFTIGVINVNEAPSGTSATITTNEDTPRVLTVADFGYSDVEGNALANVHINAVSGSGLTLNGNPVAAGDVIRFNRRRDGVEPLICGVRERVSETSKRSEVHAEHFRDLG